jgi:hypothetical protein
MENGLSSLSQLSEGWTRQGPTLQLVYVRGEGNRPYTYVRNVEIFLGNTRIE